MAGWSARGGATAAPRELLLGGDRHQYLRFHYLACELASLSAESYLHSDNLVARLTLPSMDYPSARKPEVYAQAVRGLLALEPDPERQAKYVDFIDIYAALDDNERREFQARYPDEVQAMSAFTERFTERGLKQLGSWGELANPNVCPNGATGAVGVSPPTQPTYAQRRRIETADAETLLNWSERILVAQSPDAVLR
ncbi:MAG: transposase [Nitrococcus sp.]|nr:transposase [Nitrococcus sp.]